MERTQKGKGDKVRQAMLIGAGSGGQMILRDTRKSKQVKDQVVCIIDDDSRKWGRYIDGVPVVGGRDDILSVVEKYGIDLIFVAIPSSKPEELRDILNICKETGCELKNLPGYFQLVTGEVNISSMRDVAIEDLLGREPIKVDLSEIYSFLSG